MTMVTIEDAQANLKELIHQLSPGEELLITENHQTVAKLVSHVSAWFHSNSCLIAHERACGLSSKRPPAMAVPGI